MRAKTGALLLIAALSLACVKQPDVTPALTEETPATSRLI